MLASRSRHVPPVSVRVEREANAAKDIVIAHDPIDQVHQRQAAAAGLAAFMRLPVLQRSSVILMDVLGYSLEEIAGIIETTIPAVKAALHRGREGLRAAIQEPDHRPPPALSEADRRRLSSYVERFNARDFDAVRDMLSEEVRLELVNRRRLKGREVANYFGNYARIRDWRLAAGFVERRPAILVYDVEYASARPVYFILLRWEDGQLATIRDFRHARYAIEDAEVMELA